MEKQIERKACKNCIHHRMCVDKFRKAKQDGEVLLIEEEAYFADAGDCNFYADKRIYRKQREGKWIKRISAYVCSECEAEISIGGFAEDSDPIDDFGLCFCCNCGAKMKGAEDGKAD